MGRRDRLARENRVRNFALDTETFDGEYLLVIRLNGLPLVTLGQPIGPGGKPSQFFLWKGFPEDDGEPEDVINIWSTANFPVDDVWTAAVSVAYQEALKRAEIIRAAQMLVAEPNFSS